MTDSNYQDKYGLTVKEAVKTLGICERTVRELIANNEIPHFRVGRAVRIPWQPLKEWMDNGGTGDGKYAVLVSNPHKKAGV